MSKFKVGDRVMRNRNFSKEGSSPTKQGFIGVITNITEHGYLQFEGDDGKYYDLKYELVPFTPEEEAISLLKSKGYTIKAPKPKIKLWFAHYKMDGHHCPSRFFYSKADVENHLSHNLSGISAEHKEIIEIEVTDF